MNAPQTPPPAVRSRRIWPWILGGFAAAAVWIGISVVQAVRLSGEAADLREELVASLGSSLSPRVQVSVGPIALTTARAVISFIDAVPSEAREACRSVRSVSVGVYDVASSTTSARDAAFIKAAATMERRGWVPVVRVNDAETAVLILMRKDAKRPDHLCLAVWDGEQLVVGSVRGNSERLAKLAMQVKGDRFDL